MRRKDEHTKTSPAPAEELLLLITSLDKPPCVEKGRKVSVLQAGNIEKRQGRTDDHHHSACSGCTNEKEVATTNLVRKKDANEECQGVGNAVPACNEGDLVRAVTGETEDGSGVGKD
jgi:hypothetical protein